MLDRDFFLSNPETMFFTGVLHFALVLLSAFFAFLTVNCSLPVDLLAIFSHNFELQIAIIKNNGYWSLTKLQISKINIWTAPQQHTLHTSWTSQAKVGNLTLRMCQQCGVINRGNTAPIHLVGDLYNVLKPIATLPSLVTICNILQPAHQHCG